MRAVQRFFADARRNIFVVAPHVCLVGVNDPGCDQKSHEIAQILHGALPRAVLLINELPRFLVDMNRAQGSQTNMRKQLRSVAEAGDYIFEIHSYHDMKTFPDLSSNTHVVLLATKHVGKLSEFEQRVYQSMSNIRIIQGNITMNDIALESRQKGWNHVLLEFHDMLTTKQIQEHVNEIARMF